MQSCGSNGGCQPSVSNSNPTQFSCLSNAKVCTWVFALGETSYDPTFFESGCSNSDMPKITNGGCPGNYFPLEDPSGCVPLAYLGTYVIPELTQKDEAEQLCRSGCSWAS